MTHLTFDFKYLNPRYFPFTFYAENLYPLSCSPFLFVCINLRSPYIYAYSHIVVFVQIWFDFPFYFRSLVCSLYLDTFRHPFIPLSSNRLLFMKFSIEIRRYFGNFILQPETKFHTTARKRTLHIRSREKEKKNKIQQTKTNLITIPLVSPIKCVL